MFSKLSRYFQIPDVAIPDANGQVSAAKDLRLLPQVKGTFRHTVQAGDRLDHLSYKYYEQPLQWWHICDANPGFLSPLALLGDEVIATTRFPLAIVPRLLFDLTLSFQSDLDNHLISANLKQKFSDEQHPLTENALVRIESQGNKWQLLDGEQSYVIVKNGTTLKVYRVPLWEKLFRTLHGVLGVEDVQVIEAVEFVPEEKKIEDQTVPVFEDHHSWEVRVVYNRLKVTSETLIKRIEEIESGLYKVTAPVEMGQLGKEIVIPPKVTG